MDLGLSGKACVVTGGSSGIGYATAQRLSAEGAQVLLVGRNQQRLKVAAERLGCELLVADVTAARAGERIVAAAGERFGSIDVLVNNAGSSRTVPLLELDDDDWLKQFELNVMAPMRLMRAAAPLMALSGWGRIVNVASSSGKRPSRLSAAYSAAKAAQLSLSRAYAEQFARQGVLINAVAPGPTATDLWLDEGGLADQAALISGQSRAQALAAKAAGLPRGALAAPAEIADVICFLCSEVAANVVGSAWSVDGGAVAGIQ